MQTTPTNIMQTADNSWHRRQTLHSKRQQVITAPLNQSICPGRSTNLLANNAHIMIYYLWQYKGCQSSH